MIPGPYEIEVQVYDQVVAAQRESVAGSTVGKVSNLGLVNRQRCPVLRDAGFGDKAVGKRVAGASLWYDVGSRGGCSYLIRPAVLVL